MHHHKHHHDCNKKGLKHYLIHSVEHYLPAIKDSLVFVAGPFYIAYRALKFAKNKDEENLKSLLLSSALYLAISYGIHQKSNNYSLKEKLIYYTSPIVWEFKENLPIKTNKTKKESQKELYKKVIE